MGDILPARITLAHSLLLTTFRFQAWRTEPFLIGLFIMVVFISLSHSRLSVMELVWVQPVHRIRFMLSPLQVIRFIECSVDRFCAKTTDIRLIFHQFHLFLFSQNFHHRQLGLTDMSQPHCTLVGFILFELVWDLKSRDLAKYVWTARKAAYTGSMQRHLLSTHMGALWQHLTLGSLNCLCHTNKQTWQGRVICTAHLIHKVRRHCR